MARIRWGAFELSTDSAEAGEHYLAAVAALAAGAPHVAAHFDAAVTADPCFALAHVGRAVVGRRPIAVPPSARMTRAERHHVETVAAWLDGDRAHARDLRREHLLEFPGDLLVVVLPLVLSA